MRLVTSTHNVCFGSKIRRKKNNLPQFVTKICFTIVEHILPLQKLAHAVKKRAKNVGKGYLRMLPGVQYTDIKQRSYEDQEQHHNTRTYETNVNLLLSVRRISGYYRVYYTPTRNDKPTDKNIKKWSTYTMIPLSN